MEIREGRENQEGENMKCSSLKDEFQPKTFSIHAYQLTWTKLIELKLNSHYLGAKLLAI